MTPRNARSLAYMTAHCDLLSQKYGTVLAVVRHTGCEYFSIENLDIIQYGKCVEYYRSGRTATASSLPS